MSSSSPPSPSLLSLPLPVLLGSSSKWRAQLLREMGIPIAGLLAPDIDEYAVRVEGHEDVPRERSDPAQLSLAVARAKAKALLQQLSSPAASSSCSDSSSSPAAPPQPSLLITSDQVAYFQGCIREKPHDAEQCRSWFTQYTTAPIHVCTSIVVTHTESGAEYSGSVHASQQFLPFPTSVLDELVHKGDVMGCCGGFLVDDPAILPYLGERQGTEDEIIGLPKQKLAELLRQAQEEHDTSKNKQQQTEKQ